MKNKEKQWIRNCPECNKEIKYKNEKMLNNAIKNQTWCYKCRNTGKNNPMYGRKMTDEEKHKISNSLKGRTISWGDKISKTRIERGIAKGENNPMYGKIGAMSGKSMDDVWFEKYGKEEANKKRKEVNEKIAKTKIGNKNPAKRPEVRKKISIAMTGENHPLYGKKRPDTVEMNKKRTGKNHPFYNKKRPDHSKKMRLCRLKEIEKKSGQVSPNYNQSSIPLIESIAKQYNIIDLQHAENGGEFYIKELGYWVDGYNEKYNIVFEYMEKAHENSKEKDERRRQEIIEYLGCKFIEIWYDGKIKEYK